MYHRPRIGSSLDQADQVIMQRKTQDVPEHARPEHRHDGGILTRDELTSVEICQSCSGSIVVVATDGMIGGQKQQVHGTACQ